LSLKNNTPDQDAINRAIIAGHEACKSFDMDWNELWSCWRQHRTCHIQRVIVKAMHAEGASLSQIAKIVGRKKSTIEPMASERRRANHLNRLRTKHGYKNREYDEAVQKVCETFGVKNAQARQMIADATQRFIDALRADPVLKEAWECLD
jgi:transposase